MSDKFVVTPLRGEDDATMVTVRMPNRLVERLGEITAQTGRSRTNVIVMALEYALDRIDVKPPPNAGHED